MDIFIDARKREFLSTEGADRPLKSPVPDSVLLNARAHRKSRLVAEINRHGYGAILLYDPVNIRYATDVRNQQVWSAHNASHYVLVFADGYVVDFSFVGSEHIAESLETVQEARTAINWIYLIAGEELPVKVAAWADELVDVLRSRGAAHLPLAVDKLEPLGVDALRSRGITLAEGQRLTELARSIKNHSEIDLMRWTIRVAEAGMARMYENSIPGKTEQEIWAELHYENIRSGGEWIETRLLSAGRRTNPWWNECSDYVCREGDLLAFDTDMIGPYGYCADLSRSWTIGHTKMSAEQRRLYSTAMDQIEHNVALLEPGLSFEEFNLKSWQIPDRYLQNRYPVAVHGVGLCDEYPLVQPHPDFAPGYGDAFAANMVVCVESLIGDDGGRECVKLETQVLIEDGGARRLEQFPFEDLESA